MSEYFLRLDPYNYDTELDYLLANDIYTFDDYKNFYQNYKITKDEFEKIKEYYGII